MVRSDIFICELCPRNCRIAEGHSGDCRSRIVVDGELKAVTYGKACAAHIDPVEKKPLFHFLPGTTILSIATAGCNLHCKHCQNWAISQANPEDIRSVDLPPEKLVRIAKARQCSSIAYTYTEPIVFYEYTLESSRLAQRNGLRNAIVTAGYINRKPQELLCEVIDASNTDLKSFSDIFYRDICDGRLKPVLDGLVVMKEKGVWLEVTNLVIPTLNDDMKMISRMCRWMLAELGPETPLHISRFHPMYKLRNLPPTPVEFLMRARELALDIGLHYVYVGNAPGTEASHTACPHDGTVLIRRHGYTVLENNLENGKCPKCRTEIPGIWG
jgi:pyruvate formate lyase activating enzyme